MRECFQAICVLAGALAIIVGSVFAFVDKSVPAILWVISTGLWVTAYLLKKKSLKEW